MTTSKRQQKKVKIKQIGLGEPMTIKEGWQKATGAGLFEY